jgi:hypothetical protein
MTELRTVAADDWRVMRDIRLDALREAPYAFASTYDREAAYPEQTWQERAAAGNSILAHLPESGDRPVGLVAAIELVPGELELVSMWVRPEAGRSGRRWSKGSWRTPGPGRCRACTCG